MSYLNMHVQIDIKLAVHVTIAYLSLYNTYFLVCFFTTIIGAKFIIVNFYCDKI